MPQQNAPDSVKATQEPLLPDFCAVRILLFVVLTTELLVMAISLAADPLDQNYVIVLGLRSLYGQWLGLTSAALLCRLRPWLARHYGPGGQGMAALLLVSGLSLLLSAGAWWFLRPGEELGLFLLRFWGASLIFTGLLLRYLYVQYLQRLQAEAEAQARFQALQSRIRPHFLFNSMNTIAGLTRSQPELAEQLVIDLADLFRASLSQADQLSSLEEELELARRYLNIEALRLGQRLKLDWRLEALPQGLGLPRLSLQPLLENAVYHGIEGRLEGGCIRISSRVEGDRLLLELENPLPTGTGVGSQRQRHGLGLDNVRARLSALYANRFELTTTSAEGRFRLRLALPLP
ncbi:histidine kinase [Magnetovirga frankeli]|uniref:sensor histidine kinase n=1 Tax=Magnetovirga frankeli TaxID=947516 RepID=UPI001292FD83|nr:histidine kinase [gamma proteobacterium SS-5]